MVMKIVYIAIGIIIFTISSVILKKSKFSFFRKNGIFISLFLSLVIIVLSLFIPFENAFVSFSSPQEAFNHWQNGEIKAVLDGENSTMIIAEDYDNSNQIAIMPKAANKTKWKIGTAYNIKNIAKLRNDNVIFYIYSYKKTNDYYIIISIIDKNVNTISDNCGSDFILVDKNQTLYYYYNYVAYIKNYNDDYMIFINNEEIKFSELISIP